MREDPVEGEDVTLAVTAENEDSLDQLAASIDDAGGTVEERLQFGTLEVRIRQEQTEAICALDGIESIQTTNAVGIDGDAGEDL